MGVNSYLLFINQNFSSVRAKVVQILSLRMIINIDDQSKDMGPNFRLNSFATLILVNTVSYFLILILYSGHSLVFLTFSNLVCLVKETIMK